MRNSAGKVPEDVWPDFKVRAQPAYQARSRAISRELAAGVDADYGREYDSAVACFMDDFEACIAHLRFPVTHRRAIRTTNLLEHLFVEERHRLKMIPNAFGEKAVLKLMSMRSEPTSDGARSRSPSSNTGKSLPSEENSIRHMRPKSVSKHNSRRMRPCEGIQAIFGLDPKSATPVQ
jgi:transposase-like protein